MPTARRSWRGVATAPVYTPSIVHTIRPTPVSRSRAIQSLWKIAEEVRSRHCPSSRMSCFLAAELSLSLAMKPLVQLARAALQEPSWMTPARVLDWTKFEIARMRRLAFADRLYQKRYWH